jgi:hypothetical protein
MLTASSPLPRHAAETDQSADRTLAPMQEEDDVVSREAKSFLQHSRAEWNAILELKGHRNWSGASSSGPQQRPSSNSHSLLGR